MAVALAPIILVLSARVMDAIESDSMRDHASSAAEAAAEVARRGTPDSVALDSIARGEAVRLRIVGRDGELASSVDHDRPRTLRDDIGDLFFGPGGVPTLEVDDAALPAPQLRPEVSKARSNGKASDCQVELAGKILVCRAAIAVDGTVVLAEKSSARAIRSFYDARYPLLKLTLYVSLVGIAMAAWLGRRMVRPIEALRREVLARVDHAGEVPPIPVVNNDEVGDLAEAYNTLLASLAEKRRANEAFAADLAHELKSPVAAVRAAAEALASDRPVDAGRAARLSRALSASGSRLDALVTRFLDLARAEAGLADEERSIFDLGELVRALATAAKDDERHRRARIDLQIESVLVEGVPVRIESAVRNVLENALSFAGDEGQVGVSVRCEGPFATVVISDSGPGIAESKLGRVFDRFFSERQDQKGTGLGLALSKAIVEAHRGTIEVTSPPGEGASFTLRIPRGSHGIHTPFADDSPGT